MKLLLKGHNYEYELKMLLNLFYEDMHYEIVDEISDDDITVEAIITDELYQVNYYEYGHIKATSSFYKDDIEEISEYSLEERKISKRIIKNLTYKIASQITNKSQAWGILTGIRPTKIVLDLVNKYGNDYVKIKNILSYEYLISDEKIDLMIEIVKNELKILETNKDNEVNIYIGIPFCPTKCLYCSFTSYPIDKWQEHVMDYLQALEKEIKYVASNLLINKKIKTIYIGGGTPTSIDCTQLQYLMNVIHENFDVNNVQEFTVEAGRPDTITKHKLDILKKYGVSRISINPQTMNNKTLEIIGRRHNVDEIYNAFSMAREAGFDNINMDLILGLPGENYRDVKRTMDRIKEIKPDSLTVHTMAVKRASRLKETLNDYNLVEDNSIVKMIDMVYKEAKSVNLNPYYMYRQKNMVGNYENVGYSVEGKECIYNIEIMEEAQTIFALGAGATSKIVYRQENRIERIENVKNVELYINRIDEMIDRKSHLNNI